MLSLFFTVAGALLAFLGLRWAFFARLRVVHAPFCPVCGEARGRVMGVGEETSHPYYRCPHCGHVFSEDS